MRWPGTPQGCDVSSSTETMNRPRHASWQVQGMTSAYEFLLGLSRTGCEFSLLPQRKGKKKSACVVGKKEGSYEMGIALARRWSANMRAHMILDTAGSATTEKLPMNSERGSSTERASTSSSDHWYWHSMAWRLGGCAAGVVRSWSFVGREGPGRWSDPWSNGADLPGPCEDVLGSAVRSSDDGCRSQAFDFGTKKAETHSGSSSPSEGGQK
jgi:hypothetical protein